MKLLYLVPDGGFFLSHRLGLALAAQREGFQVLVATPADGSEMAIRAAGLEHTPVRLDRSRSPLRAASGFLDVLRLYRRQCPDLLHHVSLRAVLAGGIARRLAGSPPAVHLFSGLGWVYTAGPWPLRRGVELLCRAALGGPGSRAVFQNREDLTHFVERGVVRRGATALIGGSGVDPQRFRPAPEPPGIPTVLMASRMLRHKGVEELVQAGRLLRAQGHACRIVLAGRTDPANPSSIPESRLRGWAQERVVDWLGYRDDVPALLAASHIACLPSHREGLPRFLLEAGACGRPVVASDVAGCREIVEPGVGGLLVPPRDPVALAEALARLLDDPPLRARMGAAARARVLAAFTEDVVIRQFLDLYRELLGGRWPSQG